MEQLLLAASAMNGIAISAAVLAICALVVNIVQGLSSPALLREVSAAEGYWEGNSYRPVLPLVILASGLFTGVGSPKTRDTTNQRLEALGNPLHLNFENFLAICLLTSVASALLAWLIGFVLMLMLGAPFGLMFLLALIGAQAGAVYPWMSLSSDVAKRAKRIDRDLPYGLDLMLLMLEAGANIPEALQAVANEGSYGPLGEELTGVVREVQHGNSFAQAMANFARRVPSDDILLIVQALTQGVAMGTPMAHVLRDQADLLRLKRTQNAERLAKEAGSKMTFPIVMIMFATFLLVLGPAMLKFGDLFST